MHLHNLLLHHNYRALSEINKKIIGINEESSNENRMDKHRFNSTGYYRQNHNMGEQYGPIEQKVRQHRLQHLKNFNKAKNGREIFIHWL